MAKFEVYKDSAGEFRFRLKASNGQVIATGESYRPRPASSTESPPSNATPPTPPSSTSPPDHHGRHALTEQQLPALLPTVCPTGSLTGWLLE